MNLRVQQHWQHERSEHLTPRSKSALISTRWQPPMLHEHSWVTSCVYLTGQLWRSVKSALISICHWCRRTLSQAQSMILTNLRQVNIGIGIEVKVCADLDSDGLALLKCFDIGWGIRQICLLVESIGFSVCSVGEEKWKYKHKYKYKSAELVRRKLTTCWKGVLQRPAETTSRD